MCLRKKQRRNGENYVTEIGEEQEEDYEKRKEIMGAASCRDNGIFSDGLRRMGGGGITVRPLMTQEAVKRHRRKTIRQGRLLRMKTAERQIRESGRS